MKSLIKYLKNRETAIQIILKKAPKSYTPGTFHKLRVEIKKLFAIFDLVNYCVRDFKKKEISKPFKLIFDQAGVVRELQVEEAMLKKYFPENFLANYKTGLKKLQQKERNIFFLTVNKKSTAQLKKKFLETAPFYQRVNDKKAKKYLEKKRKKIRKLISQKDIQTKQLHSLRKELKKFQYNQKILAKENKSFQHFNKDVLPQLLGKWHDIQVLINQLKKSIDSGKINQRELKQLRKAKADFYYQGRQLYQNIKVTLPKSTTLLMSNM